MSTTQAVRTKVEYQAQVESRAGKLVMKVERIQTDTPISNRGNEWSRMAHETTVQVVPIDEIDTLMTALADGLVWGVKSQFHESDDERIVDDPEPRYVLMAGAKDRIEVGRFWSCAEAEQAGRSIPLPKDGRLTVRRASDLEFVVAVVG